PLREVAQALGISHQRVQQIVKAGGGTWWSRVWHGRKLRPDMVCSFCGKPPAEVAKLIAGPKVYICDKCVGAAERVLRGEAVDARNGSGMSRVAAASGGRCSFCGRRSQADRRLANA